MIIEIVINQFINLTILGVAVAGIAGIFKMKYRLGLLKEMIPDEKDFIKMAVVIVSKVIAGIFLSSIYKDFTIGNAEMTSKLDLLLILVITLILHEFIKVVEHITKLIRK